jgi:putative membrane protein
VLSVHMVQHMLLLLIAPLLLLTGRPALLALKALPSEPRRSLARALMQLRPLTGAVQCLAVFYAAVLVTHLPSFYDSTLRHPALHTAEHGAYLLAGVLLWWPLLDADPARRRRLGGVGKLVYLIFAMAPMALVGAYLNRHVPLVYPSYAAPARALGINPLSDQADAGAIMWVIGNTIMIAVGLWVALATLVAAERRQQTREAHAG